MSAFAASRQSAPDARNSLVVGEVNTPHRLDFLQSQEALLESDNDQANNATNDGQTNQGTNDNETMENQAVSYAIEVSLAEQASRDASNGTAQNSAPQNQTKASDLQKDMVDYVEGMYLRTSNEFPILNDPDADTVVYIGPPPQLPRQTYSEYHHIRQHFEQPLYIRSASLKALQSKYFDELLGPKSLRTEKRLRKHGVLDRVGSTKLARIKYFIDLQPKIEDDEGAFLVADLTCTAGVLKWHHAQKKYKISGKLVLGTDRFDTPENPYYSFTNFRLFNFNDTDQNGEQQIPEKEKIISAALDQEGTQEYCQVRHRSGIERLLQAIEGKDPRLDSAPKVWTFFALAKFFNCANQDVVRKWIVSWLYDRVNANFIQSNPETVYKIGMGIQDADTVWDAYSILVGEKAMIMVYGEARPDIYSPLVRSVHGRPLLDLEDNEHDRISHAASSLVQRIREIFASLTRSTLWLNDSKEYSKLERVNGETDAELEVLSRAKNLIAEFVRGKIHWVLCQTLIPFHPPDLDQLPHAIQAFHFGAPRPFCEVYNILNQPMRLFTRTLWMALQRTRFELGHNNTGANGTPGGNDISHLAKAMLDCANVDPLNGIKTVNRNTMTLALQEVNEIISAQRRKEVEARHSPETHEPHLDTKDYLPETSSVPETLSSHQLRVTNPDAEDAIMNELDMSQLQLHSPKRTSASQSTLPDSAEKRRKVTFEKSSEDSLPRQMADDEDLSRQSDHRAFNPDPHPEPGQQLQQLEPVFPQVPDHSPMQPQPASSTTTGPSTVANPTDDPLTFSARDPRDARVNQTFTIYDPAWQTRFSSSGISAYEQPGAARNRSRNSANVDAYLRRMPNRPRYNVTVDDYLRRMQDQRTTPPSHIEEARNFRLHPPPATRTVQTLPPVPAPDPFWPVINSAPLDPRVQEELIKIQHIQLDKMLHEFSAALHSRCDNILYPAHLFHTSDPVPTNLIDTLTCLQESEWKYLPLWAEGLDDGTGGVFDEADVPNLEGGGFRGGKRGMTGVNRHGRIEHDKDEVASLSTDTNSTFDDIQSEAMSTVGKASKNATDGTETVKSLQSDASSETDFMAQNEIYQQIMEMKMDHDQNNGTDGGKGKGKAAESGHVRGDNVQDDYSFDDIDDEDGDGNSTVMGAGSEDVQGDMFYDLDDDEDGEESAEDVRGKHGNGIIDEHPPIAASDLERTATAIPIRSGTQSKSSTEKTAGGLVDTGKSNAVGSTKEVETGGSPIVVKGDDSDSDGFEII